MEQHTSIFALFGGVRPMARELQEPASNVYAWERAARIPAVKQAHVLKRGIALGLPVTAELVIFPTGDVPEVVARAAHRDRSCTPSKANSDAAAVFQGVDRSGGTKYGNRSAALHTCDRAVQA